MLVRPALRTTLLFLPDEADAVAAHLARAARSTTDPAPALVQPDPAELASVDLAGIELVVAVPEVVERHPGCPACALRWDLIRELPALADRRRPPRHVIVRGGPHDDPATVVQTLVGDLELAGQVELDGIVTVVDAPALATRLRTGEAWDPTTMLLAQVRMADTLLLAGTEWLTEAAQWEVAAEVARRNPAARLQHRQRRRAEAEALLHQDAWSLPRIDERLARVGGKGSFTGGATITMAGEVDEDLLAGWVDHLHDHFDAGLLRWQGTFALAGTGRILHAQGVRSTVEVADAPLDEGRPAEANVLVVADEAEHAPLRDTLDGCRA